MVDDDDDEDVDDDTDGHTHSIPIVSVRKPNTLYRKAFSESLLFDWCNFRAKVWHEELLQKKCSGTVLCSCHGLGAKLILIFGCILDFVIGNFFLTIMVKNCVELSICV